MHGVLAETGAILLQLQLLPARLATKHIVVVARFFADEEHTFGFLLALGHGFLLIRSTGDGKMGIRVEQVEPTRIKPIRRVGCQS